MGWTETQRIRGKQKGTEAWFVGMTRILVFSNSNEQPLEVLWLLFVFVFFFAGVGGSMIDPIHVWITLLYLIPKWVTGVQANVAFHMRDDGGVSGETDGSKTDLGGRVFRAFIPWVGGIAEGESVTDDFQFPDMSYCFLT